MAAGALGEHDRRDIRVNVGADAFELRGSALRMADRDERERSDEPGDERAVSLIMAPSA